MKTVNLQLVGLDGNAYALVAAFRRQTRRENWAKEEIDVVVEKCQENDYNHLLCTLMEACEEISEEEMRMSQAKNLLEQLVEFDGMPPSLFEGRELEHNSIVRKLHSLGVTDEEGGLTLTPENEEIMDWYTDKFC